MTAQSSSKMSYMMTLLINIIKSIQPHLLSFQKILSYQNLGIHLRNLQLSHHHIKLRGIFLLTLKEKGFLLCQSETIKKKRRIMTSKWRCCLTQIGIKKRHNLSQKYRLKTRHKKCSAQLRGHSRCKLSLRCQTHN